MDIVDVLIMLIPAGMVAFVLFEVGCCMFGEARKPQDGAGEGMPYRTVVVRRRLRRMLFVAAAVTFVGGVVSALLSADVAYFCSLVLPMFVVGVAGAVTGRKVMGDRIVLPLALCCVTVVVVVSLLPIFINSTQDLDVTVAEGRLKISGSYGETIPLDSISTVMLVDKMPYIERRTNGYSFNGVALGRFETADGRSLTLHSYSGDGPFVRVVTRGGRHVYLNSRDSGLTRKAYALIRSGL